MSDEFLHAAFMIPDADLGDFKRLVAPAKPKKGPKPTVSTYFSDLVQIHVRRQKTGVKTAEFNANLHSHKEKQAEVQSLLNRVRIGKSRSNIATAYWLEILFTQYLDKVTQFYADKKINLPNQLVSREQLFDEEVGKNFKVPGEVSVRNEENNRDNDLENQTNGNERIADIIPSNFLKKTSRTKQESAEPLVENSVQRWQLSAGKLHSVDDVTCTLNLDPTQISNVGEPFGFLVKLSIGILFTECDLMFGVKSLAVKTDINTEDECEIRYNSEWDTSTIVGMNGNAISDGTGIDTSLVLSATEGILKGRYEFFKSEFFSIKPKNKEFEFGVEMAVHKFGMSLTQTDGTALPDENKRIVIESLIAKDIGPMTKSGRIPIAKKRFKLSPDTDKN